MTARLLSTLPGGLRFGSRGPGVHKNRLPPGMAELRYFSFMKKHPYAYTLCAAALLGLPLAPVSMPAADEAPVPATALKKYDANKDGALDEAETAVWMADKEKQRAERAARRAEDLARYDEDKDGKLEKDERAVMQADKENARAEKKAAREAKRAEKAAALEAKKLARYDRNQDGKLDADELAAMQADDEKRKAAAAKRRAAIETRKQAQAPEDGGAGPDAP